MKRLQSEAVRNDRPFPLGLFLLGALLTLFLFVPQSGSSDAGASGCPYLSQASSAVCPHAGAAGGSGCPCMAGAKGSGCPYLTEEKGCLHALKHGLKLDEEQMGKVREIQGRFLDESADLRGGIREMSAELDRLFRDPDASVDGITAKQKSLAEFKARLEEMAMDYRLKIRGELTAEQLRQIPEGCWHGVLGYGHGHEYKAGCHKEGCKGDCICPHKGAHPDVSA